MHGDNIVMSSEADVGGGKARVHGFDYVFASLCLFRKSIYHENS